MSLALLFQKGDGCKGLIACRLAGIKLVTKQQDLQPAKC